MKFEIDATLRPPFSSPCSAAGDATAAAATSNASAPAGTSAPTTPAATASPSAQSTSASPGASLAAHDYTGLRGEVLPFIRLHALFGSIAPPARRQSIVVVRHAGKRAGIVVDALLGEFQTVIKPLGKIFAQVDCVSGSSILGTGEVALILDVSAVVERAIQRSHAGHPAGAQIAAA